MCFDSVFYYFFCITVVITVDFKGKIALLSVLLSVALRYDEIIKSGWLKWTEKLITQFIKSNKNKLESYTKILKFSVWHSNVLNSHLVEYITLILNLYNKVIYNIFDIQFDENKVFVDFYDQSYVKDPLH